MFGVELNGLGNGCSFRLGVSLFLNDTSCSITACYHLNIFPVTASVSFKVMLGVILRSILVGNKL